MEKLLIMNDNTLIVTDADLDCAQQVFLHKQLGTTIGGGGVTCSTFDCDKAGLIIAEHVNKQTQPLIDKIKELEKSSEQEKAWCEIAFLFDSGPIGKSFVEHIKDTIAEYRKKLEIVHNMGLRFSMIKTSDKPEPYIVITWTEDSDHERMFQEWTKSITLDVDNQMLICALKAIKQRIDGEFNALELMSFDALSECVADLCRIAEETLKKFGK